MTCVKLLAASGIFSFISRAIIKKSTVLSLDLLTNGLKLPRLVTVDLDTVRIKSKAI